MRFTIVRLIYYSKNKVELRSLVDLFGVATRGSWLVNKLMLDVLRLDVVSTTLNTPQWLISNLEIHVVALRK